VFFYAACCASWITLSTVWLHPYYSQVGERALNGTGPKRDKPKTVLDITGLTSHLPAMELAQNGTDPKWDMPKWDIPKMGHTKMGHTQNGTYPKRDIPKTGHTQNRTYPK